MKDNLSIVRSVDRDYLRTVLGQRVVTLASGSPRRRDILAECGVRFRVVRPRVEEPPPEGNDPRGWTRRWASRKTLSVQRRQMNDIILAADTVVVHRGRSLGKPKDAAEAAMMLRRLSGQPHRVVTGFAVLADWGRKQVSGSEESMVRFRKLTEREIEEYVATTEPLDKAGAYAIQGHAREFVTEIEGPLDNIVGLPVRRVAQVLNRVINGRTQK